MYLSASALNVFVASLCLAPSVILANRRVAVVAPEGCCKHQLFIEGVQGIKNSLTFEATGDADKPFLLVEADAGEADSDWGAGAGRYDFGDNARNVNFPMIPQQEADPSGSYEPCNSNGISITCQPFAALCPGQ